MRRQNRLSAAVDRLGATAMRRALLRPSGRRWRRANLRGVTVRAALVEVYPAAALRAWATPSDGCKEKSGAKGLAGRVAWALIVEHRKEETGATSRNGT